ncbi:hypothetical protein PCE1_003235 [Barthelona sp. PCE]
MEVRGGEITNGGTVVCNDVLNWDNGTISGIGTTLNITAPFNFQNVMYLEDKPVLNIFSTWTYGSGTIVPSGETVINILKDANVDFQVNSAAAVLSGTANIFNIYGNVTLQSTQSVIIDWLSNFHEGSNLFCNSGLIAFNSYAEFESDTVIDVDCTVLLENGTFAMQQHADFSGAGTLDISNATLELNGHLEMSNISNGVILRDSNADFTMISTPRGSITIKSGTLQLDNGNVIFDNLQVIGGDVKMSSHGTIVTINEYMKLNGGTYSLPANSRLIINGEFDWVGDFASTGRVEIGSTGVVNMLHPELISRAVENDGTIHLPHSGVYKIEDLNSRISTSSSGRVFIYNNTRVETFDIDTSLVVDGEVLIYGDVTLKNVKFTGAVHVFEGNVRCETETKFTGELYLWNSSVINFNFGTHQLSGSVEEGTVVVNNASAVLTIGSLDVKNTKFHLTDGQITVTQSSTGATVADPFFTVDGGSMTFNPTASNHSVGVLLLNDGLVTLNGAIYVKQALNITGGEITGTGKVYTEYLFMSNGLITTSSQFYILTDSDMTLTSTTLRDITFVNMGEMRWNSGSITMSNGIFINEASGTLRIIGLDCNFGSTATGIVLINKGLVKKEIFGTTSIAGLQNMGNIRCTGGILQLISESDMSGGSVSLKYGSQLQYKDGSHNMYSSIEGDYTGILSVDGEWTQVSIYASLRVSSIQINEGTVTIYHGASPMIYDNQVSIETFGGVINIGKHPSASSSAKFKNIAVYGGYVNIFNTTRSNNILMNGGDLVIESELQVTSIVTFKNGSVSGAGRLSGGCSIQAVLPNHYTKLSIQDYACTQTISVDKKAEIQLSYPFSISSSARIEVDDGNVRFMPNPWHSPNFEFEINAIKIYKPAVIIESGAKVTLLDSLDLTSEAEIEVDGELTIQSGKSIVFTNGLIHGSGTIVTDTFVWKGGNFNSTGTLTTSQMTIKDSARFKAIAGEYEVTTTSSMKWEAGAINFYDYGKLIIGAGVLAEMTGFTANSYVHNSTVAGIYNYGVFKKLSNAENTEIQGLFNYDDFRHERGKLYLTGFTLSTGKFTVGQPLYIQGVLSLQGTSAEMFVYSTISLIDGVLSLDGASFDLSDRKFNFDNATIEMRNNATLVSSIPLELIDVTLHFKDGISSYVADVEVTESGRILIDDDARIGSIDLNRGLITGSANLTVDNLLLQRGTINSSLVLHVKDLVIDKYDTHVKDTVELNLENGTLLWIGGKLLASDNARVTVDADSSILFDIALEEAVFEFVDNSILVLNGSLHKTDVKPAIISLPSIIIGETGSVYIRDSILQFNGTALIQGNVTHVTGDAVVFANGEHVIDNTATLTVSGQSTYMQIVSDSFTILGRVNIEQMATNNSVVTIGEDSHVSIELLHVVNDTTFTSDICGSFMEVTSFTFNPGVDLTIERVNMSIASNNNWRYGDILLGECAALHIPAGIRFTVDCREDCTIAPAGVYSSTMVPRIDVWGEMYKSGDSVFTLAAFTYLNEGGKLHMHRRHSIFDLGDHKIVGPGTFSMGDTAQIRHISGRLSLPESSHTMLKNNYYLEGGVIHLKADANITIMADFHITAGSLVLEEGTNVTIDGDIASFEMDFNCPLPPNVQDLADDITFWESFCTGTPGIHLLDGTAPVEVSGLILRGGVLKASNDMTFHQLRLIENGVLYALNSNVTFVGNSSLSDHYVRDDDAAVFAGNGFLNIENGYCYPDDCACSYGFDGKSCQSDCSTHAVKDRCLTYNFCGWCNTTSTCQLATIAGLPAEGDCPEFYFGDVEECIGVSTSIPTSESISKPVISSSWSNIDQTVSFIVDSRYYRGGITWYLNFGEFNPTERNITAADNCENHDADSYVVDGELIESSSFISTAPHANIRGALSNPHYPAYTRSSQYWSLTNTSCSEVQYGATFSLASAFGCVERSSGRPYWEAYGYNNTALLNIKSTLFWAGVVPRYYESLTGDITQDEIVAQGNHTFYEQFVLRSVSNYYATCGASLESATCTPCDLSGCTTYPEISVQFELLDLKLVNTKPGFYYKYEIHMVIHTVSRQGYALNDPSSLKVGDIDLEGERLEVAGQGIHDQYWLIKTAAGSALKNPEAFAAQLHVGWIPQYCGLNTTSLSSCRAYGGSGLRVRYSTTLRFINTPTFKVNSYVGMVFYASGLTPEVDPSTSLFGPYSVGSTIRAKHFMSINEVDSIDLNALIGKRLEYRLKNVSVCVSDGDMPSWDPENNHFGCADFDPTYLAVDGTAVQGSDATAYKFRIESMQLKSAVVQDDGKMQEDKANLFGTFSFKAPNYAVVTLVNVHVVADLIDVEDGSILKTEHIISPVQVESSTVLRTVTVNDDEGSNTLLIVGVSAAVLLIISTIVYCFLRGRKKSNPVKNLLDTQNEKILRELAELTSLDHQAVSIVSPKDRLLRTMQSLTSLVRTASSAGMSFTHSEASEYDFDSIERGPIHDLIDLESDIDSLGDGYDDDFVEESLALARRLDECVKESNNLPLTVDECGHIIELMSTISPRIIDADLRTILITVQTQVNTNEEYTVDPASCILLNRFINTIPVSQPGIDTDSVITKLSMGLTYSARSAPQTQLTAIEAECCMQILNCVQLITYTPTEIDVVSRLANTLHSGRIVTLMNDEALMISRLLSRAAAPTWLPDDYSLIKLVSLLRSNARSGQKTVLSPVEMERAAVTLENVPVGDIEPKQAIDVAEFLKLREQGMHSMLTTTRAWRIADVLEIAQDYDEVDEDEAMWYNYVDEDVSVYLTNENYEEPSEDEEIVRHDITSFEMKSKRDVSPRERRAILKRLKMATEAGVRLPFIDEEVVTVSLMIEADQIDCTHVESLIEKLQVAVQDNKGCYLRRDEARELYWAFDPDKRPKPFTMSAHIWTGHIPEDGMFLSDAKTLKRLIVVAPEQSITDEMNAFIDTFRHRIKNCDEDGITYSEHEQEMLEHILNAASEFALEISRELDFEGQIVEEYTIDSDMVAICFSVVSSLKDVLDSTSEKAMYKLLKRAYRENEPTILISEIALVLSEVLQKAFKPLYFDSYFEEEEEEEEAEEEKTKEEEIPVEETVEINDIEQTEDLPVLDGEQLPEESIPIAEEDELPVIEESLPPLQTVSKMEDDFTVGIQQQPESEGSEVSNTSGKRKRKKKKKSDSLEDRLLAAATQQNIPSPVKEVDQRALKKAKKDKVVLEISARLSNIGVSESPVMALSPLYAKKLSEVLTHLVYWEATDDEQRIIEIIQQAAAKRRPILLQNEEVEVTQNMISRCLESGEGTAEENGTMKREVSLQDLSHKFGSDDKKRKKRKRKRRN